MNAREPDADPNAPNSSSTPRSIPTPSGPSGSVYPGSRKTWRGVKRGVIGVIRREDRFLVIRRSRLVTAPMKLCLPGGTIEMGESEQQALVREMQEELSIDVSPLHCCYRSRTPWGTRLAWWAADLDADATPKKDPAEVDEFFWMTPAEIESARGTLPSLPEFCRAIRTGKIDLKSEWVGEEADPKG